MSGIHIAHCREVGDEGGGDGGIVQDSIFFITSTWTNLHMTLQTNLHNHVGNINSHTIKKQNKIIDLLIHGIN